MSEEVELRVAWSTVAGRGRVGATASEVFDDLVGRHRQPHRRYHTVRHVVWVIRHVRELADLAGPIDLPIAVAAAMFHDAVYDATASDNEQRSAALARRQLAAMGWTAPDVDAVALDVLATADHLDDHDPPPDPDVLANGRAVLLDADLTILGADPAAYRAYADGVRVEYGHLDHGAWRRGRTAVIDRLLSRRSLFLTAPGRQWWEQRARANLTAEAAGLRDS